MSNNWVNLKHLWSDDESNRSQKFTSDYDDSAVVFRWIRGTVHFKCTSEVFSLTTGTTRHNLGLVGGHPLVPETMWRSGWRDCWTGLDIGRVVWIRRQVWIEWSFGTTSHHRPSQWAHHLTFALSGSGQIPDVRYFGTLRVHPTSQWYWVTEYPLVFNVSLSGFRLDPGDVRSFGTSSHKKSGDHT